MKNPIQKSTNQWNSTTKCVIYEPNKENCNKNQKLHWKSQKSDGFENDATWHTCDVIMTL